MNARTLEFPGGAVVLAEDDQPTQPHAQRFSEPEIICEALRRVMGELDDLIDAISSRGEWSDRVRIARRELGKACTAASKAIGVSEAHRREELGDAAVDADAALEAEGF